MEVVVATEARFSRGSDGVIRSPSAGRAYGFWSRYLDAFDAVRVLARVEETDGRGPAVAGPGVVVHALPDYVGVLGLLKERRSVRRAIKSSISRDSKTAYVARVPGSIGSLLSSVLMRADVPFALEVVGDAEDALLGLGLPYAPRRLIAAIGRAQLRRLCRNASAAAYVTEQTLQRKYPPRAEAVHGTYSSVELPADAFHRRSSYAINDKPLCVVVGTLSQAYKGHDVLIEALARLKQAGVEVDARIVGGGRLASSLEALAVHRGLAQNVTFVGQLESPVEVRRELDLADVFVLPSRTEGLPRALLEAMARSLPCVATAVGGVPEVLEERCLVESGDADALAARLREFLTDASLRAVLGHDGYARSQHFRSDLLAERRVSFYRAVRDLYVESRSDSRMGEHND